MNRGRWARDLLVLTLFLGLLIGFKLGSRALWSPDEGRYSEIPREMVASGDYLTPRLNGVKYFEKPPLFYWLQSVSIKLFGLSEWSLRLWTALFGLLGCLAVYLAGRRLFERTTGLVSSVVLATSLLYYGMSRIITLDMAVSVLLSCALLAFLLGLREPVGSVQRRVALWAFYCFAALAVLTKGLIGVVIPGLVIGAWMALLGEWRTLKSIHLPSGLALFLLIAAPWHILVSQANPEFFNFYFIHEHFQRYLTRQHGRYQQPWFFIPVLLGGLFPWSVFLVQALRYNMAFSWHQRHQHKETLFLILWAAVVFVFFSGSSSKLIPYILPMFPPVTILIGRYLAQAWDRQEVYQVQGGFCIAAIVSLIITAGVLFVSPHFLKGFSEQAKIAAFNYALAVILTVGSLATLFVNRFRGFRYAFVALASTTVLMLLVANSATPLFDQRRSVKALALVLRSRLKPTDEVANYRTYYQDLPVYLERRITLVDEKGELSFGSQVEDVSGWIIDDAGFWRRWNGPNAVYLMAPLKLYNQLRAQLGVSTYLVAKTDWDVLLTNQMGTEEPSRR